MKAVTKNISLTPELDQFIDSHVESGPTRGRVPRSSASAKSQRAVPGRRPAADPADAAVPRAACITSSEAVAGRRTHSAANVLLTPGDARSAAESDSGVGRTSRAGHDAALHDLSPAALDSVIRLLDQPLTVQSFGDILETGRVSEEKING
jgi:hypothetical protein